MIPTWMIEEIERQRRQELERQWRERPQLHVELPLRRPEDERSPARPARSGPIVIDLVGD